MLDFVELKTLISTQKNMHAKKYARAKIYTCKKYVYTKIYLAFCCHFEVFLWHLENLRS